ncbi:hypothetical protein, partial [Trinickia sp.]|uniref:hypothetical protein n=1 Tax=Trinickia sp. TaxID=2571163 RepID=UPI003F81FD7B
GRSAPEQQRQEENGDAAACASHVPYIETNKTPTSSKNFSFRLPAPSSRLPSLFLAAGKR